MYFIVNMSYSLHVNNENVNKEKQTVKQISPSSGIKTS